MVEQWGETAYNGSPQCGSRIRRSSPCPIDEEQCDTLYFGHLVRSLRVWKLWPGQIDKLVSNLEARTISRLSPRLKKIVAPRYHEHDSNHAKGKHIGCGWTAQLHRAVEDELEEGARKEIDAHVPELDAQQLKFYPKEISVSKFQKAEDFKGIQVFGR